MATQSPGLNRRASFTPSLHVLYRDNKDAEERYIGADTSWGTDVQGGIVDSDYCFHLGKESNNLPRNEDLSGSLTSLPLNILGGKKRSF